MNNDDKEIIENLDMLMNLDLLEDEDNEVIETMDEGRENEPS
jgi:hypothetical protein